MSKELALDGLGVPASTPNAEVAPFFLGERAGRASSVTRSRRARWSVIQEIRSVWTTSVLAARSLSTRMRQWVHEISVGAPPRSLGSWVG